ncbi:hypothetical protein [Metabacillus idriensis]|uniref:hypothetical protein n=1 Tax=Metabacillus idriensis TaxID=324768 RepID=UPI003D2934D3
MPKKIQIPSNLLTHHYIQNEKSEVKIVTPQYELNPDDYFFEELSKAFKTEAMELFYSYVRKANRTDGEHEFEFK